MPLPRSKDTGGSAAPVLNLPNCVVKFAQVEEYTEPRTVTRRSDQATFQLDPQFNCTLEVVDDGKDGSANGITFFEGFRYKSDGEGGWHLQENSKLGQLAAIVKPNYFTDMTIPELTEEDLTGFMMRCRVKPKRNPTTGQATGSSVDWETMQRADNEEVDNPVGTFSSKSRGEDPDDDWEQIPF